MTPFATHDPFCYPGVDAHLVHETAAGAAVAVVIHREAFARHYGTAIVPTRPYTPRHKGKVERGVDGVVISL